MLQRQSKILPDLGQGCSWLQNIKGALFIGELHQFMLCQHYVDVHADLTDFISAATPPKKFYSWSENLYVVLERESKEEIK